MRLIVISLSSLLILAGLLAWNSWSGRTAGTRPIVVYCAVALQPAIEEIAREFEAEVGIAVQVEYGASQVLLTQLELRRDGDLFIPADDSYLHIAEKKDLLESSVPVTRLRPVVAVAAGNPLGIKSLDDLIRREVRLSLPDPKTAAIGRVVRAALGDWWEKLWRHGRLLRSTVGDVASDVQAGAADATFVWEETARQFTGLAAIELPEFANVEAKVAAGILRSAHGPDAARSLVRYMTATDRGQAVFQKRGYRPMGGKPWARPEGG